MGMDINVYVGIYILVDNPIQEVLATRKGFGCGNKDCTAYAKIGKSNPFCPQCGGKNADQIFEVVNKNRPSIYEILEEEDNMIGWHVTGDKYCVLPNIGNDIRDYSANYYFDDAGYRDLTGFDPREGMMRFKQNFRYEIGLLEKAGLKTEVQFGIVTYVN